MKVKNIFGEGELYEAQDVKGSMYVLCCACMSIYAEFLSWANTTSGKNRLWPTFMKDPYSADSMIVLSCQVTDLVVLNDIRTIENLMKEYPDKDFYVGGCLARRFDIELPGGVKRLDIVKSDYTSIEDKYLVDFQRPFWISKYKDVDDEFADGHLFRNMYPLRISVGCKQKCTYCTVRTTRGDFYELDIGKFEKELLNHKDVLLIADSPLSEQLAEIIDLCLFIGKPISIRNVEPHVSLKIMPDIQKLTEKGLLKVFHSPIQSDNSAALKDMGRNPSTTLELIRQTAKLREYGVTTATNIIIDYKDFLNPNMEELEKTYDYISWNPYWDGKWDRKKAEARFTQYLE